jgi:Concanavalin A-like lectin/glucanases superfamily
MTQKHKNTAFSLIEISIVILLIGLIVAGIAQAGRLIAESTITSARAQTKGSPVIQSEDMVLWLETTMEDSFLPAESEDGVVITKWLDINPISGKKALDATATAGPTYTAKALNGLPALNFNGTTNYMTLPDGSLPYKNDPYTIFLVSKITAGATGGVIIGSGLSPNNNWFRYENAAGAFGVNGGTGGGTISGIPTAANSFRVITVSYDGTTSTSTTNKIYVNTVAQTVSVIAGIRNTSATPVTIGSDTSTTTGFLNGMIAEIIVYRRALEDSERVAIERYLSKKWKIRAN